MAVTLWQGWTNAVRLPGGSGDQRHPTAARAGGLFFELEVRDPLLGAAPAPGRRRPKGGGMARQYETVYIFDPALEEPAITEKLEKFHALLTKDGAGTITNVAHWGKRTLAYPIKKRDAGYYVVAQFEAAAAALPEYQRAVKLDEGVLRFLTVVSEGLPAKPAAAPAVIAAEPEEELEEEEA
jgi:small subunit ribosomal protein S6